MPPPHSLEDLFRRYRETGEPRLLADVYDRVAVKLLAVAMHLSGDAADAEDAVQTTFLAALESAHTWQPDRPLEPWLTGILINRVRELRRARERRPEAGRLKAEASHEEPSLTLATNEFNAAVEEAIDGLPRLYQSVLVLRLRHDMSPIEIAHALRRPPGTVRAQLARGLEMVRKALPAGMAGALLMLATPTRGLAGVRAAVLEQAEALHAARLAAEAARATQAAHTLKVGGLAVTAVLALAVAAALFLVRPGEAAAMVPTDGEAIVAAAALPEELTGQVVTVADEPAGGALPAPARRVDAGALRVELRYRGRPAPGGAVVLEPGGAAVIVSQEVTDRVRRHVEPVDADRTLRVQRGTSDAEGAVTFAPLEPGAYLLHHPLGTSPARVVAGQTGVLRMELDGHVVAVRGTVVDAFGMPAEGAAVHVRKRDADWTMQRVATTDRNGVFEVFAAPESLLTVSQPGSAVAWARLGDPQPGYWHEIRLRLGATAGTLRGVVRDTAGRPVPHAVVAQGMAGDRQPSRRILAGADGTFEIAGLAPGTTLLRTRAAAHGAAELWTEVAAGATHDVELVVPQAARVHGVATDADGTPLAGARVVYAAHDDFEKVAALTDADGRFELRGLTPGRIELRARGDGDGRARTVLEATPGATVEWNPRITADGSHVGGRVLLPDGAPLVDGWIVRSIQGIADSTKTRTDRDGRFRLRVPDFELDVHTQLQVFLPGELGNNGLPLGFPVATRDVRPGEVDLDVRVAADAMPSAWLTGAVRADPGLLGERGLLLRAEGHDHRRWIALTDAVTPFDIGPLPPGRYRLSARKEAVVLGPFELGSRQRLDVGTLEATLPGDGAAHESGDAAEAGDRPDVRRTVRFHRPRGHDTRSILHVVVRDARDEVVFERRLQPAAPDWRTQLRLPPGPYRVTARTPTGLDGSFELFVDEVVQTPYAIDLHLTPGDGPR